MKNLFKSLIGAMLLLVLLFSSCTDNPLCIEKVLSAGETSVRVGNLSPSGLQLESIRVEDLDGNIPSQIILSAPDHDNDQLRCKFVFPKTVDGLTYSGNNLKQDPNNSSRFEADNVNQRATSSSTSLNTHYCPVAEYQGDWLLSVEYPGADREHKVEVCFYYAE